MSESDSSRSSAYGGGAAAPNWVDGQFDVAAAAVLDSSTVENERSRLSPLSKAETGSFGCSSNDSETYNYADLPVQQQHESKITRPSSSRLPSPGVINNSNRPMTRRRKPLALRDATLAQSVDILKYQLRQGDIALSSSAPTSNNPRVSLLTKPQEPRFQQLRQRKSPKSTEEKEQELMDKFNANKFKARPVPEACRPSLKEKRSRLDLEEEAVVEVDEVDVSADQEPVNDRKPFKARPIPSTTYISPDNGHLQHHRPSLSNSPTLSRASSAADSCSDHPTAAATTTKTTTTSESPSTSPANAYPPGSIHLVGGGCDGVETDPKKRKFSSIPREIKPFQLQSVARHEEYQKQLSEQRRKEEEQAKQLAEFRARPYSRSSSSPSSKSKIPSHRSKFRSVERHEEFERYLREKVKNKEVNKNKQLFVFKAKRLPWNIYNKSPSSSSAPPTEKPGISEGTSGSEGEATNSKAVPTSSSSQSPSSATTTKLSKKTSDVAPTTATINPLSTPSSAPDYDSSWHRLLGVFTLVSLIRLLNVFLLQSYFDPDEFWQTLEPAYCQVFGQGQLSCPGFTWEWKRRAPDHVLSFIEQSMLGPARCYLSVMPTYVLYWAAKKRQFDTNWVISRGPMFLSALTVAAPVDFAVWYAARRLYIADGVHKAKSLAGWCLFCSLASWFNGYSLVRTFANSQETFLLVIAVALVSPELLSNRDAPFGLARACAAFLLGGLSSAIRFTSLAAFVPMGIILAMRRSFASGRLAYVFVPCAAFGLTGLACAAAIDRQFYGLWTLPFLGNFHFNVVLNHAGLYGTHPWHWYFTAGLPAITGLLLPMVFACFTRFLGGQVTYGERNLCILVISYLLIMSGNAHKEFRYMHPVLPLVCLLTGPHVCRLLAGDGGTASRWRQRLFASIFATFNLTVVVYLGLFHQSGPIVVNRQIVETSQRVIDGRGTTADSNFSIYYLTGGCHSTPLHSQLHSPPAKFDTWSLDCSPDCRSNPELTCEANRFAQDPIAFVEAFLCLSGDKKDETCKATGTSDRQGQQVPDFVVTYSSYVNRIHPLLESAGLQEIGRYPHHINGAKIGNSVLIGDYNKQNDAFRRVPLLNTGIEISLEDVILYSLHRV